MRFDMPFALVLLFAVPLFIEEPWRGRVLGPLRRWVYVPRHALYFVSAVPLTSLPHSFRQRLRNPVLSIVRAAAFVCLVFALARPQTGTQFVETEAHARDILMVVDASGSMAALDFQLDGQQTDRMTALKSVVKDFIKKRAGDRMGLIVFGTEVYTQCPLTLDQRVMTDFVDGLEVGMAGDATALGDAVGIAIKRLKEIEGKSKVLVLVTDGLKTAGQMDPKDAAEIAKKFGIKVYSIGIGGKEPAPFKTTNMFGFETTEYREVPIDEETLKMLAEVSGGKYFHASNTKELTKIYDDIDTLELRAEKAFEYIEYEEHFFGIALLGFLLLLVGETLRKSIFATIP